MANQTVETGESVERFLSGIEPPERRADAEALAAAMARATGEPPAMWGPAIVGFGHVHYRNESGREGDMPRIAFSPRKHQLALYGFGGAERHAGLLARLGRYSTGKSCIYLKRLADADAEVLDELLAAAWTHRSAA